MVDTEMTATPTQQPEALRLADVLEKMPGYDWNKTYCEAAFQLRHIQRQNECLTAENEALRIAGRGGDGMTCRTTPIKINHQGDVKLWHDYGYCVVGGPDAVCFYVDVDGRADITGWTKSDANCPVIFIGNTCADTDTIAEFPEFPGWRVHATNGGKTLAVALVREGAEE